MDQAFSSLPAVAGSLLFPPPYPAVPRLYQPSGLQKTTIRKQIFSENDKTFLQKGGEGACRKTKKTWSQSKLCDHVVRPEGFEPPAFWSVACSGAKPIAAQYFQPLFFGKNI